MRIILFIFNFSKRCPALFLAIAIIAGIETKIAHLDRARMDYSYLETVVRDVEKLPTNKPYFLIGDSVAEAVYKTIHFPDNKADVYATNMVMSIPGQYFFVQHYLETNHSPKAVIFLGNDSFDQDLNMFWTEINFQRTFNAPSEVLDVFIKNFDLSFAMTSLAYYFIPSYRYRLKITDKLIKNLEREHSQAEQLAPIEKPQYSIVEVIRKALRKQFSRDPLSDMYFKQMAALLEKKNIKLYFIAAPMGESRIRKIDSGLEDEKMIFSRRHYEFIKEIQSKHKNFFAINDGAPVIYEDRLFGDGTHLTAEGRTLYAPVLQKIMDDIMKDTRTAWK